jgi:N-acetylmuramoyl-L-alanine amidase
LKAQSYKTNVRRIVSIVLTLIFIIGSPVTQGFRQEYRIRTVVIDAGHGGEDSGCLGASAKEKHIALAIALKLGKLLETTFPDLKVVYTRKTDVFIPLHERAAIANHHKADLFICIHCNSGNKAAFGVETFVMGLHKTDDNLAVAKRENAAILLEEDYKKQYEGFDPNSPEANIIFNLYQNQFLNQSLMFASNVQEEIVEYAGRHNRGVKQAGFLVLYKTAMPSVLIEAGFLTNDGEEKYLLSDKGQINISTSIFRAFRKYKVDTESPGSESASIKQTIDTSKTTKPEVPVVAEVKKDTSAPKEAVPAKKIPVFQEETMNTTKPKSSDSEPVKTAPVSAPELKNNVAYFTVQIGASQKPESIESRFSKVSGLNSVKCDDGFTRFNSGNFSTLAAAKKRQAELKAEGYTDCFVTAYKGDKKLTIAEATLLLQKK